MLLGFVLLGRTLEARARAKAASDVQALAVGCTGLTFVLESLHRRQVLRTGQIGVVKVFKARIQF